jgi:ankyrin repeat protein
MKQLDKEGSDLNMQYPDHFNWTPLIAAIYFQNRDIIEYLIDRGVDVTKRDATGKTALIMAIIVDDTNTGTLLLGKASQTIKSNEDWRKVWDCIRTSKHSATWHATLDAFLPTNSAATNQGVGVSD